ncbi:hypothetical protein LXA43DRAFT_1100548 [Ganoderma leucocontextum]|nr:hypothetical protein LXA43DRAFT_1100548 [Ganoderma leucocontextum]
MTKFDETTLRELSWDNLKAVAKENGVHVRQKRDKITDELLKIGRPKMTQLAKLRGDKGAIKMEKIRRRTVGHVKTPPRPTRAGTRRARASTSRQAPEPAQPQPRPQVVVEAPTPAATSSEGQAESKPEEKLRPLERARARYLLEKAERERRAKEEVALAEAQPPSVLAPEETVAVVPSQSEQPRFERRVLFPMGVHVPFKPFKPRRTPGLRREDMPDEWRVGLLSPDPSNPRPVFSPPTKPRDEPEKVQESGLPLAPAPQGKEVARVTLVEEQEQVDDVDTDTELAEEEEVFEMTSMNDIHVGLPEDGALVHVDEGEKTVREKKRKAEEEGEEENIMTTLEQSPKKRRRTSFRGWLLGKVF